MFETDEIIATILSKKLWYVSLGWDKYTASNFKNQFKNGIMPFSRKAKLLNDLGYTPKWIETQKQP